jgi:hypothetical protein
VSPQALLGPSFDSGGAIPAMRSFVLQVLSLSPVIHAKISTILLITKVLACHHDLLQALAFFS